ncbi:hypothetical protein [Arthrobacter sp. CP30]
MTDTQMSTEALDPETFDLAGWISGAKPHTESVTVYQRPDVIGDLAQLERRMKIEEAAVGVETSVGEETSPAKAEYIALARKFTESALTFYVRGIDVDEQRSITEKLGDDATKERLGSATIAAAIVAVQPPNGEKRDVTLTADQVDDLRKAVGDTQMSLINNAWLKTTRELPSVDADFLRALSSPKDGDK